MVRMLLVGVIVTGLSPVLSPAQALGAFPNVGLAAQRLDDLQPVKNPLRKRPYCIRCTNGEVIPCNIRVGGEGGKVLCGAAGMLAKCRSGSGSVSRGHCT